MAALSDNIIEVSTPKRVLYFSDGILEEFDDEIQNQETKEIVDERQLNWEPWFIYKAKHIGRNILSGLDYVGESLADIFNISTPKYLYEIEEFKRHQQLINEEEKLEKNTAWNNINVNASNDPITEQPQV